MLYIKISLIFIYILSLIWSIDNEQKFFIRIWSIKILDPDPTQKTSFGRFRIRKSDGYNCKKKNLSLPSDAGPSTFSEFFLNKIY